MFFLSPNSFAKEFMLFSGLPWRGVYKICLAKAQGFQDCAQGSLGWGGRGAGGGSTEVSVSCFVCYFPSGGTTCREDSAVVAWGGGPTIITGKQKGEEAGVSFIFKSLASSL